MNKIGILTLHEENSYGAVLQAYALQKSLKTLGGESEFIRFEKMKAENVKEHPASPLAKMLLSAQKVRNGLFDSFRDKYLNLSTTYSVNDEIDERYSFFIVGSDQVWNFSLPNVDGRYLLPFAQPKKRCSYAASFGTNEIPEIIRPKLKEGLDSFSFLSVREESGKQIISSLIEKDATVCLDPSLLLNSDEYAEIEIFEEKEKYVFCFMLSFDPKLKKTAEEYAKSNNLKLIMVTASFMPPVGVSAWNSTGVEKWIGYIHHAEAVFTNSFHCSVLSLLFERKLGVQLLKGELADRNGRIIEYLNLFHANDALNGLTSVSYNSLQCYLRERRNVSIQYLEKMMEFYD